MKKKIALAMLVCMCGAALFAQIGPDGTKEEQTQAENTDIKNIQLAYSLADYGWENDSATALLQAAEILSGIPTQEAKIESEQEGTQKGTGDTVAKDYSPEKILADARKLAGKDKNIKSWADRIEKALKTVTRGASYGPETWFGMCYGYGSTRTRGRISFDGGRLAEVYIGSSTGADLDVYVYDDRGNLVAYDESYASDAYVWWYPRYTGRHTIIVKNRSPYDTGVILFTN